MHWKTLISVLSALSLLGQGLPRSSGGTGPDARSFLEVTQGSPRGDVRDPTAPSPGKLRLEKAKDPEAIGLLIHLLDRYASDVADKREIDRRIEERLARTPGSRETARRMMANFRRIPSEERRRVLERWGEIPVRERIDDSRYREVFERFSKSAERLRPAASSDEHGTFRTSQQTAKHGRTEKVRRPVRRSWGQRRGIPPDWAVGWNRQGPQAPMWLASHLVEPLMQGGYPRYILWYEGLWCHRETDADHGTDSDEIYVITTVADMEGNVTVRLHPQPSESGSYEDVDDGDHRTGPRRQASGNGAGPRGRPISGLPAQDLGLVVAVYELDGDDPRQTARDSAAAAAFVGAVCALGGPINCLIGAAATVLLLAAVVLLTGGNDDLISAESLEVSAAQLQRWAAEQPHLKKGDIPYHFSTVHDGGGFDIGELADGPAGADYHVYFTVREVPPPPVR